MLSGFELYPRWVPLIGYFEVIRQNPLAGSIAKSMASEGNSALLPANVDRRPPLQQGLMNFQLQNFQLCNKSLKDWPGPSGNS